MFKEGGREGGVIQCLYFVVVLHRQSKPKGTLTDLQLGLSKINVAFSLTCPTLNLRQEGAASERVSVSAFIY